MANIFLAWELGEGYGHLRPLAFVADQLQRAGHTVSMAARRLGRVARAFQDAPAPLFQAPLELKPVSTLRWPTLGFADVLFNTGFDDADTLRARVRAWQTLFESTAADLVLANHSPTAVLAARCLELPLVTIGNGFEHPAPGQALPIFPHSPDDAALAQVARSEQQVLDAINACLDAYGKPRLTYVGDLFDLRDRCFLTTLAECDHYGPRAGANYYDVPLLADGDAPRWPAGTGDEPRVFAYLGHSPQLEGVLARILALPLRLLVFHVDIPAAVVSRLERSNVVFTQRLVDLEQVAGEAAFALTNANHATTCQLLLEGLPCVLAPLQVEQALFARQALKTGAVLSVDHRDAARWVGAVQRMLHEDGFRAAATTFAQRYPAASRAARRAALWSEIRALVPDRDARAST